MAKELRKNIHPRIQLKLKEEFMELWENAPRRQEEMKKHMQEMASVSLYKREKKKQELDLSTLKRKWNIQ